MPVQLKRKSNSRISIKEFKIRGKISLLVSNEPLNNLVKSCLDGFQEFKSVTLIFNEASRLKKDLILHGILLAKPKTPNWLISRNFACPASIVT